MSGFAYRTTRTLVALALSGVAVGASAKDVAGGKDHPLVSRFAGATMTGYSQVDFDEAFLPNQPVKDAGNPKGLTVEGKVTRINYTLPLGKSLLETERNYTDALTKGGFEVVFKCAADQCGGGKFDDLVLQSGKLYKGGGEVAYADANRAVLAKLSRAAGDAYVFLYFMKRSDSAPALVFQEVVEARPMQTGQVSVQDAKTIQQTLASAGKIALYGVYFDTDRADVKPESKAQLDEMAKMLSSNAALKVYVVGHTDNQGMLAHNLDLSQKRADSVVRALTATYHIAANRLMAKGVASLAPMASNTDEAGRAKNRRVELVVQ